MENYEGKNAEQSLALAELYEAWSVLSIQERVEGFQLLQQDDADDFFLHLSARDKAQLILALPTRAEIVDEAAHSLMRQRT